MSESVKSPFIEPEKTVKEVKEPKVLTFRQKKNAVRKMLKAKGFMAKGGLNTYDKYMYFSEAQYKALFVELFADCGLEFKADTLKVEDIQGTEKMAYGRRVTIEVELQDIDTDVCETSRWVGEAFDKTDKGIYKAYTGALKYYFADTWHVPTGDDPEADKREPKSEPEEVAMIQPWQKQIFTQIFDQSTLAMYLAKNNIESLDAMTFDDANKRLEQLKELSKARQNAGKTE